MNGFYIEGFDLPLFPIGDLANMCNVTRKMILNYEDHGLLYPARVEEKSGYRYYDATSAARIRHILALQKVGFSLREIHTYLDGDETQMEVHLKKLEEIKSYIEQQISISKALLTKPGEMEIRTERMEGFEGIEMNSDGTGFRDTYMLIGKLMNHVYQKGWQFADGSRRMITSCSFDESGNQLPGIKAMFAVLNPNEESHHFEETNCLCVNVRGDYSELPVARKALADYAKEHGLKTTGEVRTVYLTSPQSHHRKDNHVSQLFMPIKAAEGGETE